MKRNEEQIVAPGSSKSVSDLGALRIRVAELCGWSYAMDRKDGDHAFVMNEPGMLRYRSHAKTIPDYPNDLNACHEFKKRAPMGYADAVRQVVANDAGVQPAHLCDQYLIHATAEQRCRAFVAVMEQTLGEKEA